MGYFENLTPYEKQKKEIETIAPRTITLNLSTADCIRLSKKAGSCGLSVSELLENFIGDLVNGTFSNGIDEQELAEHWFNRCGFSWCFDSNLLTYLIGKNLINEFLEDLYKLEELQKSVSYWISNSNTKQTKEVLDKEQKLLVDQEGTINDYIEDYFKSNANHKTKEIEIDIVKKWRKEMETLQGVEPLKEEPLNQSPLKETFYTIYEASNIAGVEHHTIRRHIKEGRLKATRRGRAWQITEDDLKEYLKGE